MSVESLNASAPANTSQSLDETSGGGALFVVGMMDPTAVVDIVYARQQEINKQEIDALMKDIKARNAAIAENTEQINRLSEWKQMEKNQQGEAQQHLKVLYDLPPIITSETETVTQMNRGQGKKVRHSREVTIKNENFTRSELQEMAEGKGRGSDPKVQQAAKFLVDNPAIMDFVDKGSAGKADGVLSEAELKRAIWPNNETKEMLQVQIDKIRGSNESLQTLNDMAMSDLNFLRNESNEYSSGRSSVAKKGEDVNQTITRNIGG